MHFSPLVFSRMRERAKRGTFGVAFVLVASLVTAQPTPSLAGGFTIAAPLAVARGVHSATLLSSGEVLVAGGYGGSGYLASAELYDPAANTWGAAA